MKNFPKSILKRGFTLIEMVVTLSIIAILAVVITTQFNGDSAKATRILNDLTAVKKAALRFYTDTGKRPCALELLWQKDTSPLPIADQRCTAAGGPGWDGPYIEKMKGTSFGRVDYSEVIDGSLMRFVQWPVGTMGPVVPGYRYEWVVMVIGIPKGVASELMKKCTGNASVLAGKANFANSNCNVGLGGSNGTMHQVSYLISYIK